MKTLLSILAAGAATAALGTPAIPEAELIALEKASWEAWKARDASFYERTLSDDHMDVHGFGIADKAAVVATVASPACVVEGYTLDGFRFRPLGDDAAMLTYRAEQKTTCNGKAVPSPVWVSSVYARRNGRWVNVLFQQTPAR